MRDKILRDLDLEDETFISPDELIGYFNEALSESESEILTIYEDYFLTEYWIPLLIAQNEYELPFNIYGDKIRKIMYHNGPIIYEVERFKRLHEFSDIAYSEQYGQSDDYRYLLTNDVVGPSKVVLHPTSRETAITQPFGSSQFFPLKMRYIRNCNRVPLVGEYCNPEFVAVTQVNTGTNRIAVNSGTKNYGIIQKYKPGCWPGSIAYKTGDAVRLKAMPNGTLPTGFSEDTTYYVYLASAGVIGLASSKQNALAGTTLAIPDTGTGGFIIRVAATTAIIESTIIDIPEFATFVMQWVKVRCLEKEGDPRTQGAALILVQQKEQMVSTLTKRVPDDDDCIQGDFSLYSDMS